MYVCMCISYHATACGGLDARQVSRRALQAALQAPDHASTHPPPDLHYLSLMPSLSEAV